MTHDKKKKKRAPNACSVLRPIDVLATRGQIVLDTNFPISVPWHSVPLPVACMVYRQSATGLHSGSMTFVVHEVPTVRTLANRMMRMVPDVRVRPVDTTTSEVVTLAVTLRVSSGEYTVFTGLQTIDAQGSPIRWNEEPADAFFRDTDNGVGMNVQWDETKPWLCQFEWSGADPLTVDLCVPSVRLIWWN